MRMRRGMSSRQRPQMVQKQNLNAPGGMAEAIARANDGMDDRNLTGASGPDSRLKPWYFGLGYEMLAMPEKTVQMSMMPSNEIPPKPERGSFPKPKGKGSSDGMS